MSAGGLDGLGDALVEALADAVAARLADRLPDPEPTSRERRGDGRTRSRLAVSVVEAAELIGCSEDHFRRHVLPDLRIVRSGRLRLVPVAELEAWLDLNAARALAAVA